MPSISGTTVPCTPASKPVVTPPLAWPDWLADLAKIEFADAAYLLRALPTQGEDEIRLAYRDYRKAFDDDLEHSALSAEDSDAGVLAVADGGQLSCPAAAMVFAIDPEQRVYYLCLPAQSLHTSRFAAVTTDESEEDADRLQVRATAWMPWETFRTQHIDPTRP